MWYEQIKSSNPVQQSNSVIQSSNLVQWLDTTAWEQGYVLFAYYYIVCVDPLQNLCSACIAICIFDHLW